MKRSLFFLFYSFAGMVGAQTPAVPSTPPPVPVSTANGLFVDVSQFGAKGDGVTDDAKAIEAALSSNEDIFFENKTYLVNEVIRVAKLTKPKTIRFGTAVIHRSSCDNAGFVFDHSADIDMEGGTFLCENPHESPNGEAAVFQIVGCSHFVMRDAHINGSGQMGVCIMGGTDILMEHNWIQNTFRDGIYSHYSVFVRYINNRLSDVKDDALSMHDYGLPEQKPEVLASHLKQAGSSMISGNIVTNCYEGISSISCDRLIITNNIVNGTVNAGIVLNNNDTLFKGTDATVQNIVVANNIVLNACKETEIMAKPYPSAPPVNSSMSAICVESMGPDQTYNSGTRLMANVTITGNDITDCGSEGIFCNMVKNLVVSQNSITDCNTSNSHDTENAVGLLNCTNVVMTGNNIVDDRATPLHGRGYDARHCTGVINDCNISGYSIEPFRLIGSKLNK